jgi:hypothetical protein
MNRGDPNDYAKKIQMLKTLFEYGVDINIRDTVSLFKHYYQLSLDG